MNHRTLQVCAWCGVGFTALFAIGFAIAGFIPPPAADDSPVETARLFAEDRDSIRIGLQIAWSSSALFFPFVALLSILMRRIEGQECPMAMTQLAAGIGSIMVFIFPLMNMQAAAYRSGRSPETVQALFDLGWLPFIGIWAVPGVQCVALAVVIFGDRRPEPLFPRWSAYFNLWVAALFVPGLLIVFFKTGPFAWNGLFCWWLPAIAFFGWIVVMTRLSLKAIPRGAT